MLPRNYAKERGEETCVSRHGCKQEFLFSEVFSSTSPYDILKCRCISFLFRVPSRFSAGDNSFSSSLFIRYSKNELLSKVNRIQGRGVLPRSSAQLRVYSREIIFFFFIVHSIS